MGRTVIILPDDLEKRFKSEVFRRLGMKKGNITRAIQEAIELWIGKNVGLWEELISLGKYIDEMVKRAIKEIESDPKLTPEQKNIAKEFFIRRVKETFPIFLSSHLSTPFSTHLSTLAKNISEELKTLSH